MSAKSAEDLECQNIHAIVKEENQIVPENVVVMNVLMNVVCVVVKVLKPKKVNAIALETKEIVKVFVVDQQKLMTAVSVTDQVFYGKPNTVIVNTMFQMNVVNAEDLVSQLTSLIVTLKERYQMYINQKHQQKLKKLLKKKVVDMMVLLLEQP